jgi:competence protein ComEA
MDERGWQLVAWGVAAIVVLVLGVRVLTGGEVDSPPVRIDGPAEPGPSGPSSAERKVYVHVAGAVRRPGLYRVADGGRVAAAIDRAGGPKRVADLSGVNLAARVSDGQQIVVPARNAHGAASSSADGPIGIGSATVEQLEELDGIGPALAERIVEHRQASGGFSSLDELDDVDGIGAKRLEALKEALAP